MYEDISEVEVRSDIIKVKVMIMSLKVNYKCQSGGMMCIHVGFYVIWYVLSCKLRWWASPPQLDLPHCIRVYIQGRH